MVALLVFCLASELREFRVVVLVSLYLFQSTVVSCEIRAAQVSRWSQLMGELAIHGGCSLMETRRLSAGQWYMCQCRRRCMYDFVSRSVSCSVRRWSLSASTTMATG